MRGDDANQLVIDIADLRVRNTFPGEVFMDVAIDALDLAGVDRRHRIDHPALLSTHLTEISFRGSTGTSSTPCSPPSSLTVDST